jgi:hypothetical protein
MLLTATTCAQAWDAPRNDSSTGLLLGVGLMGGSAKFSGDAVPELGAALVMGVEHRFNRRFSIQLNGSWHTNRDILFDLIKIAADSSDSNNGSQNSSYGSSGTYPNPANVHCTYPNCHSYGSTPSTSRSTNETRVNFDRFPVELLAHLYLTDRVRIGGGVRAIRYAAISEDDGVKESTVERLGKSTGGVLEAELFMGCDFKCETSVKLRVTKDRFSAPRGGYFDSTNVGLFLTIYGR